MTVDGGDAAAEASGHRAHRLSRLARHREKDRTSRRLLHEARGQLGKRLLKLVVFLVFALLIVKVIPGLEKAFQDLKNVSVSWIIFALAIETVSEVGYVVSWRGILDPDNLLAGRTRGVGLGARVAWAQLGGGMIIPGGTVASMGVGGWFLHRLGMSMKGVAERQFVLMFLNSTIDGLAIIFFGLGLALGIFGGEASLALTLLPAVVLSVGFVLALVIAGKADVLSARTAARRPKVSAAIGTLAKAVEGVYALLRHRGSVKIVLGAIVYLMFDMLVLSTAFTAIGDQAAPSFAIVAMSYLLGGLAGSIPLPANLGAIGGMAAMLVVFGVDKNEAIAAVVLYQAIGYIVPLVGGGISYLFLRRQFGPMGHADEHDAGEAGEQSAGVTPDGSYAG
jgi:uncharacterized membrane protein YbhN (UPF0104 family)